MNESARYRVSVAQLLVASAIWGFAFVAQRAGMEYVGPFTFNGVRFLLGSAALVPLLLVTRRRRLSRGPMIPRSAIRGIGAAGLVLFIAASLQQIGIVYTTAGKAGFITGLYVVIVPLLGLLWRQRVGGRVWTGAILATLTVFASLCFRMPRPTVSRPIASGSRLKRATERTSRGPGTARPTSRR